MFDIKLLDRPIINRLTGDAGAAVEHVAAMMYLENYFTVKWNI